MNVLVTGGAGFIGSNVVELLLNRGDKVCVLDDFSHASFRNIKDLDCEIVCADITDKNIFKNLGELDAVIHEAAVTDTTLLDDTKMLRVNFEGFKNVLKHCVENKIKLVYASSAGVYGDGPSPMEEGQKLNPLNTYAYSKFLCDQTVGRILKGKHTPLIVGLRYFNVYGHREYHKGKSASMIYQLYRQMIEDKQPRVFKSGEQKRDFIYVKDVASATVKALEAKRSSIVNVGTGQARSFNDIISIINKVLSKELKTEYFDNPYAHLYQNYTEADAGFLKTELGITPRYSLEEGIKDYITNYLLP